MTKLKNRFHIFDRLDKLISKAMYVHYFFYTDILFSVYILDVNIAIHYFVLVDNKKVLLVVFNARHSITRLKCIYMVYVSVARNDSYEHYGYIQPETGFPV